PRRKPAGSDASKERLDGVSRHRTPGGPNQESVAPHVSTQLGHALARSGHGHPHDSDTLGASPSAYDGGVHAGVARPSEHHQEPVGPSRPGRANQAGREGRRMNRPTLEVGDVFRKYTPAFLERYDSVLSTEQRRVLKDLALCRTAAL